MATEKTALDYLLDAMTTLVSMNDNSLEQLQEIVDYIKENADGLQEIEISQIVGLQDALDSKVAIADIIDNLVSTLTTVPLSANQGRVLSEKIDVVSEAIETIKGVISSDDTTLDELQEIVNFIKQNKEDLQNLDLSNIAETDTIKYFTKEMKEKLEAIEEGANNYVLPDTLPISKIENLQSSLDSLSSDIENKSSAPLNISSMLEGTISLSNTIQSIGFKTYLYTGNGTTQDIVTGINMKDNWTDYSSLSLWSSGTYNTDDEVYILDSSNRVLRCICLRDDVTSDPNTLLDFTDATFSDWKIESKTFGGRVWIKSRSNAYDHGILDTIRGKNKALNSASVAIESTGDFISSFNSDGFSLGSLGYTISNALNATYVSWSDQTTFCESGLTNQNKPYIRETNAVTGYVQIKYKGSGTAGHKIPHGMGREIDTIVAKRLNTTSNWLYGSTSFDNKQWLYLNATNYMQSTATEDYPFDYEGFDNNVITLPVSTDTNTSNDLYIIYGYIKSYIDENNILQGNYEIGTYVGTGASGNKITTKAKPAYVMIKRLDSASQWSIGDTTRNENQYLYANLVNVENIGTSTYYNISYNEDSFTVSGTADTDTNASGGQYLYLVVYDNDLGSGASKYDQATETTQLQINNAILSTSSGYDSTSGVDNKISTFNGTVLPTNGWEE